MVKSKSKKPPQFRSLDQLVEFFDTHDMGDYWDEMPEAHFDVNITRRSNLIVIDDELAKKLMEIARAKHTSSEVLVNSWLQEKILEEAQTS